MAPPRRRSRLAAQRAAQLGEHRLLRAQVLLGERRVQPLEQLALLVAQPARNHDVDDHAQIAAPAAAERGHALAAQREHLARLRAGGTSTDDSPSSVGTSSVAPSAASGAATSSAVIRSSPSRTKRSSSRTLTSTYRSPGAPGGRSRPAARVPAAGQPDALPVGDPRRHLHLELALARQASAAAALAAGLLGHTTVAVADVADHRAHHLPERRTRRRLQLPGAAAALAGLDRRSGLGAVAVAVLAAVDRLEGDLHVRPASGFEQVDLHRHREVGALRRPRRPPNARPPPKNASNRSPIEPKPRSWGHTRRTGALRGRSGRRSRAARSPTGSRRPRRPP